jgi:ubiquinone biosynthesis protein Coq4
MRELRIKIIAWLFHISIAPYATLFKRKRESWGLTTKDLLAYPTESLGHETGLFLSTNSFELMEKLEIHDTFHVITGYDTDVSSEIAQQYFLFGNGKRTLYVTGVLLLSVLLLPEDMTSYLSAYRRGSRSNPIYTLDMRNLLHLPLEDIKTYLFNTQKTFSLKNL